MMDTVNVSLPGFLSLCFRDGGQELIAIQSIKSISSRHPVEGSVVRLKDGRAVMISVPVGEVVKALETAGGSDGTD